jgi:tetratricopeptide (TPR) repeat protein
VWSGERRGAIEAAFAASERPFAARVLASVTGALDRYGEEWTAMRVEACRATRVTGAQSSELLDLRMQCLDRHLVHLGAAIDVLAAADAGVVEKGLQVAQALPPIAACADGEALRAPPPLPADPAARERIQTLRGQLAHSDALFAAGKLDASKAIVVKVHEEALAAAYLPLIAEAAQALGAAQYESGDYAAAERTLSSGAAVALAARRDDLVVRMWRDLVWTVGYEQRRFDEAQGWATLAEAMLGRVGNAPREQAKLYAAIAALHLSQDHRDEALRYDQRALELLVATFGESSSQAAIGLNNLGTDYLAMRDFARARDAFARVLAIREGLLGPDHPAIGRALANLAAATAELGELDEATALQERALAVLERALGPDHPVIATTLGNLGKDLAMTGRFDEAMAAYERAMAIVAAVHGKAHPQLAVLHARRGALLRRQGKTAEGLAEYQAALAIDEANDPEGAAVGRDRLDLGDTLVALGRLAEARREYQRAQAILGAALGPDDLELAGPLTGLGQVELALGDPRAAIEPLEAAVELLARDDAPTDELSRARFDLARALRGSGRDEPRARQLAEQARQGLAASQDEQARAEVDEISAWLAAP